MAAGDYRSCDVCGGKAFYDADLLYEQGLDEHRSNNLPYRVAGSEQYPDPEKNHKWGMRLGYVGDWAVICDDCSKTHRTAIVPLPPPPEQNK